MTTYAIAQMKITDRETLALYREKAGTALAKHGGKIVTAGPVTDILESVGETPDTVALLSFPSKEDAIAWRNDPDLQEIHKLRTTAAQSTIIVIPGN